MGQVPRLYTQAKANLRGTDPVFIDTAMDENAGNRDVITSIGERIPAGSPLRTEYDAASKQALAAVDDFTAWLKDDLREAAAHPDVAHGRDGVRAFVRGFGGAGEQG